MNEDSASVRGAIRAGINQAPVGRFQILLVLTILSVLVIDGVDLQVLSLVAPLILEDWGLERSGFGLTLSAALVGMSLGALIGGSLGDRFGRRSVLIASTVLFGVATIAAGMSDGVLTLTILRLISGFGFGAAAPNGIALASDWLSDRLRPQITSLLSIGTPAGGMVGAALVLGILPLVGWRGAFYTCGILTLVLAAGVLAFARESPFYKLTKGDVPGAKSVLRRHLGVDTNAAAFADSSKESQADARDERSFLDISLWRLNLGSALGFFTLSFVSYAFIAWTPIMLSSVGFSVDEAIGAAFSFNTSAVIAALIGGFLMARFGTRPVLAGTTSILFLVLLGLGITLASLDPDPDGAQVWATYILVGASGGFAGVGMASLYTIMAAGYPPGCRAGGIGFGLMMGRIGGILASYSGGHLLEIAGAGLWPFILIVAACTAVAGACAFVVNRHVPARSLSPLGGVQGTA